MNARLNGIISRNLNKLLKNTKFWNFLFQNFFISKKIYIFAVSKIKVMQIPTYKLETIMKEIRKEGLADNAYGFKTPSIVYVYVDAMEKNEIWDNLILVISHKLELHIVSIIKELLLAHLANFNTLKLLYERLLVF